MSPKVAELVAALADLEGDEGSAGRTRCERPWPT